MNGKGDKQRVSWSVDYESKHNKIFKNKEKKKVIYTCEMCETEEESKRREDNIYVCNKCNEKYPINKENK
tara:strand:+ start:6896 stop:7105 length:210 start_codon:yes stop_codon:yes gene_type:complete